MSKRRMIGPLIVSAAVSALMLAAALPAFGQAAGGVINTNFPQPGGTQASPLIRAVLPTYGDYSNMETDPVAISASERDSALTALQGMLSGVAVVSLNRWGDARENLNALQIVNNVPIQGATYTIVLPPGWQKAERTPIVLSGNGAGTSNNERLWKESEFSLVRLVALMSGAGRSGLIAAYSNAGGTESLGVDDHTYRSVGAFMDFMAQNGGDPKRLVTFGASRGGLTALMWAINPLQLNYNAIAVFADIAPTELSDLSERSVLTYPGLSNLYKSLYHDPNGYLYSNANGPGKSEASYLSVVAGVTDPGAADAKSPIGLADKLRGKVVVIGRGTHDAYLSLRETIAFDHRLTTLDIPHSTVITLGQGHISNTFLIEQTVRYFEAFTRGATYQPPQGRFIYINANPPDGKQVPLAGFLKGDLNALPTASTDLPFTAEFPAKAGVGLPVDVSLCGTANSTYSYVALSAAGVIWTKGTGTFDADECVHAEIKASDVPDDYVWTFTYNGNTIPATNTSLLDKNGCNLPAVTHVSLQQPTLAEMVSDPTRSFGVDQYMAKKTGCP